MCSYVHMFVISSFMLLCPFSTSLPNLYFPLFPSFTFITVSSLYSFCLPSLPSLSLSPHSTSSPFSGPSAVYLHMCKVLNTSCTSPYMTCMQSSFPY